MLKGGRVPDIFVAASREENKKEVTNLPEADRRKNVAENAIKKIDTQLVRKTKNPLASFISFPSKVHFETQQREEPIVLLLRRHWITNISWILLVVLMILGPLIISFLPIVDFLPSRFFIFFTILWYLLTLTFTLEKFISWFFNIFLITDERVVDVDFYSLTYKQISDAGLDKIQDITYRTGGVVGSIINFGDILFQTAGNQPNIEFEKVPRPAQVVSILNELIVQEQQDMLNGKAR